VDELVRRAMARWPDVPAVYGWLRLDRRGRWMLVDRGQPGFDEARDGAGSPITSPPILEFIARNYESDAQGRWYWQNGPQRVFVDLEVAPWVLRVLGQGDDARLVTHTGEPVARVDSAWRTDAGELILATDLGPGAVHDLDLASLDLDFDDTADAPLVAVRVAGQRLAVRPMSAPDAPRFERLPRP
jgi:hypothetical protein